MEEILLYFGTEISFITEYRVVTVFPVHILEIKWIMESLQPYHTNGLHHIFYRQRGAYIYGVAFCSCVPADIERLGVDVECILGAINCNRYILGDFLGQDVSFNCVWY